MAVLRCRIALPLLGEGLVLAITLHTTSWLLNVTKLVQVHPTE